MHLPTALCLALLCATATAFAADGPTPFPAATDEKAWPGTGPIRVHPWMKDNRAWFWTQREKDQGKVVFVGDSLTGNWKNLGESFPGLKVANRGIGGDVSRGVLWRLQEDVLDLHPRALVLCIGSNDLSAHADPAGIIANIAAIIGKARAQDPKLPVVVSTIAPRDNPKAPMKPGAFADTNARLTTWAKGQENLVLVDLGPVLGGADGMPVAEYFAADHLHLAAPGYARWAEVLRPALDKLGVK